MSYFFKIEGNSYVLENYWFSDASLVLFRNGKELFRAKPNEQLASISSNFLVDTPEGSLTIISTSNLFTVDIEVLDDKKQIIPIEKINRSLLHKIKHSKLTFDWPKKNKSDLAFFLVELFGVFIVVWLFLEGDYLEALLLFLLSLVSLLKINHKN